MRILILGWRDPKHPLAGGAEQVVHEHAKGWIAAGHKVTLFSSRFKGSQKEEILDGVKVIRGGYQYFGVQIAAFFFYLRNKDNFDIIIDQFHGIPFFTPLYVNKPKVALIQEVARNVWFLNPLTWPINLIIGAVGYLTEPFIFLLYKSVPFVTGSESAKKDVADFGIPFRNISVVPHGVIIPNHKFQIINQKSKSKIITYLGILSRDKGIEDAIKTFFLLDKMGKFNFWVIGRPETNKYAEEIKKTVNKLKMKNKIKFWGYVDIKEKFQLLAKSYILINPSYHEGWGLVNIEANAMGVPVVAYNSAGLIDSVKDNQSGIICKENTPENIAEEVFRIGNNRALYRELNKGAINWSNRFSWKNSIKRSLNLIENIKKN